MVDAAAFLLDLHIISGIKFNYIVKVLYCIYSEENI